MLSTSDCQRFFFYHWPLSVNFSIYLKYRHVYMNCTQVLLLQCIICIQKYICNIGDNELRNETLFSCAPKYWVIPWGAPSLLWRPLAYTRQNAPRVNTIKEAFYIVFLGSLFFQISAETSHSKRSRSIK